MTGLLLLNLGFVQFYDGIDTGHDVRRSSS